MSTINNGNQILSYDFKEEILSLGFNKINYKLHPSGIYTGGNFIKVSDTIIHISPMMCLFEDENNKASIRIETLENAEVEVNNTLQYIVGRFSWYQAENNFMEFVAVDAIDILPTDLIFGRFSYIGIVLQETFDYTKKSWVTSNYYDLYEQNQPFKAIPTFPYSNSVEVLPSNGKFIHNGKVIEFITKQTTPSFTFPVSVSGRTDVVAINSDTNSINIITGTTTEIPSFGENMMPIAVVRFPPSTLNTVRGHFITYIHPCFYKNSNHPTNQQIFDRIKTVSAIDNGLDGDLLTNVHASYFVTKLQELSVLTGIPIDV
jgi:hypothetical protein